MDGVPHLITLNPYILNRVIAGKNTPISQAKEIQKKEAWADMPQKAIDYLKSLPEFDPMVFESVTGIVI